ncbi:MAG: hypothetical protein IJK64_01100 [Clostridia bacterium]|nr:hypothetical protein [Clostridia bacterium]
MNSLSTRLAALLSSLLIALAGLQAMSTRLCGIYPAGGAAYYKGDGGQTAVIDSLEAWQALTAQNPDLAETELQVDAGFFQLHNLVVFSVTLPQANYEVLFLPSTVFGGQLTVHCLLVQKPGFGATVLIDRTYLAVCGKSVASAQVMVLNGTPLN